MFLIGVSMLYWISSKGCAGFFRDIMLFVEGPRYVGLILFQEGLDQFSSRMELSFPNAGVTTRSGRFVLPTVFGNY
jgi:hypothetical protein